jgi:pSer/pThr/pTyr-binding forkhead associated (FHA) protein
MMASDWWRREMIDNKLIDSDIEERVLARIPILIATRGPLVDRTFYLEEPVVSLGRLSSNDIVVHDLLVSRHHCVIRSDGEQHMIEDLNSSNGTYVNGERVRIESLKDDSLIEIGVSQFLFRVRNSEDLIVPGQSLVVPSPHNLTTSRVEQTSY